MKLSLKLLLVCSVLSLGAFAQNMAGYTLVFEDDFNGPTLNENVWNIEVNGEGGGNNELQYYRRENVSVGVDPQTGETALILTAKKEGFSGPIKPPGNMNNVYKSATSGRVMSRDKMHFRYGVIEARIKFPYTWKGLWPAYWMMGNTKGWPACGEIDIIEMGHSSATEANSARRFSGWWHWGTSWDMYGPGAYPNTGSNKIPSYDVQGSYHIWRLEWDENNMRMYFDNEAQPYAQLGISGTGEANTGSYFRQSFFVLFNLAVGGTYTGINNVNNVTAFNSTPEPKMYVDYVRVYQKNAANEQYFGPPIGPPVAVTGITLKDATSVAATESEQLTPTIQPAGATNKNVTWKSSNNNIATVDNGLVRGVAVGTATITATTVDGNKSATCTVTVTPAPPIKPGTNLALDKPVEYVGDVEGAYVASNITDGNRTSRWASAYGQDNKVVTIDLLNIYKLTEIVLYWEAAYASEFTIEVSTDKSKWTTVQSTTSGKNGEQRIAVNNVNARYVRINCIKRVTPYGFSLYEVEVFGTSAAQGELSVTAQEISVFPNPVEDVLYIQSETAVSGVILSDLNGRKLFESKEVSNIDMSAYSAGMYLLTIKIADGKTMAKKIIKK